MIKIIGTTMNTRLTGSFSLNVGRLITLTSSDVGVDVGVDVGDNVGDNVGLDDKDILSYSLHLTKDNIYRHLRCRVHWVLMGEDPPTSCYVCFSKDKLLDCNRCVYKVCESCIVMGRFVTMKVAFCRHPGCFYDHLSSGENEKRNCFVCRVSTPPCFFWRCQTCQNHLQIDVDRVRETIKTITMDSPNRCWKRQLEFNNEILYFTILDIDSGEYELINQYI